MKLSHQQSDQKTKASSPARGLCCPSKAAQPSAPMQKTRSQCSSPFFKCIINITTISVHHQIMIMIKHLQLRTLEVKVSSFAFAFSRSLSFSSGHWYTLEINWKMYNLILIYPMIISSSLTSKLLSSSTCI